MPLPIISLTDMPKSPKRKKTVKAWMVIPETNDVWFVVYRGSKKQAESNWPENEIIPVTITYEI